MYDILVKNANVYGRDQILDIAIENGKIVKIESFLNSEEARQTINANGNLASPGFVDSHMHLDKALSLGNTESPTLQKAVENFTSYLNRIPPTEIKEDIKRRARDLVRMCCMNGTTALRTHANVESSIGLRGVEALNELRDELSDYMEIQITALPNFYDGPAAQADRFQLLDKAAAAGLLDYIGGAMHLHDNCIELTEKLFSLAVKYNLPVDFHVDEHDHPDVSNLLHIAKLTKRYGYEGRVSCGHVTALSAVDDDTAKIAIQMVRDTQINIITLPSCNLYLMGRNDKQPIRRGVTRIREFIEAGVNISYASDNIRDPFRPIGNGNMLEEGLLTAQVAQMVTKTDLEKIFAMGTVNPAKAMGLSSYGLQVGKQADLVVLDMPSAAEVIVSNAIPQYVIKNGKVVAHSTHTQEAIF